MKRAPLVVVVGETASGKSDLALAIARALGGELICADSWTVRREMNVGTAKPTSEALAEIPHHLLNLVDPDEDFTAAVFKQLAVEAINDISARGKVPILVGGTGLYIDGVIFDYGFLQEGDRSARESLSNLTISDLLAKIAEAGIELGAVDTRNKRRLIRLLETGGAQPTRQELRTDTILVGIQTDRELLRERVMARVDAMLQQGLEDEVRTLADRYGWESEGLKGVGYAQWKNYFLGQESIERTRERIIKATLDLAKRQRTWFKRNKSIQWFSAPVNQTQIVDFVTTWLNK